ncbi:hypothetical protein T4A_12365 [Trichinella pseudospiralis]|uniref:Uncharacterized protein n=1 Tax=Trichinella pseudospiralis TaxID=6337 RepID=A0A0V1EQI3_TRIPS|nr:hypothetical protein T4A_12365 [Trichinella pseudospiralis]
MEVAYTIVFDIGSLPCRNKQYASIDCKIVSLLQLVIYKLLNMKSSLASVKEHDIILCYVRRFREESAKFPFNQTIGSTRRYICHCQ